MNMGEIKKTPMDVLDFFLRLQQLDDDEGAGDVITNLKAQKLLYYAQGVSLAKLGTPLFDDDFVAWQHGPVIKDLYHKLKCFGSNQIVSLQDLKISKFTDKEQDLLVSVYKTFGQFSAWKLRDMTHAEDPWKNVKMNDIITKESIREFFSRRYAGI